MALIVLDPVRIIRNETDGLLYFAVTYKLTETIGGTDSGEVFLPVGTKSDSEVAAELQSAAAAHANLGTGGSFTSGDVRLGSRGGAGSATLLLDALDLIAAGAYSTRKLRAAYAGSAIRVRRSNDNAEQDIGFSGEDLDTASLATFVGANSGFLAKWYDQSGNADDVVQATAGNQPRITLTGTLDTKNNQPCPVFNTVSTGTIKLISASGVTVAEILAVFSIGNATPFDWDNAVITGTVDVSTEYGLVGVDGTGAFAQVYTVEDVNVNGGTSNNAVFNDALQQVQANDNDSTTWGGVTIGGGPKAGNPWVGSIGEAVLFASLLSAGNRTTAYNNQKAYWGTP